MSRKYFNLRTTKCSTCTSTHKLFTVNLLCLQYLHVLKQYFIHFNYQKQLTNFTPNSYVHIKNKQMYKYKCIYIYSLLNNYANPSIICINYAFMTATVVVITLKWQTYYPILNFVPRRTETCDYCYGPLDPSLQTSIYTHYCTNVLVYV